MDGDCSARTIISAADSGCIFSAGCGHFAAVDGDSAARVANTAADARAAVITACGQRSHFRLVIGLGINGKTVALCHIDAVVDGQSCAIRQNQVDIPGNGDEFINCYIAVDHIPAAIPCGRAAVHHNVVSTFLGFPVLPIFITGSVRNRWRW